MPFPDDEFEIGPGKKVVLGYSRLVGPLLLHARMQNCLLAALCAVVLQIEIFVLVPGPEILEDAQQEATFADMDGHEGVRLGRGSRHTIISGFIFATGEYYYFHVLP